MLLLSPSISLLLTSIGTRESTISSMKNLELTISTMKNPPREFTIRLSTMNIIFLGQFMSVSSSVLTVWSVNVSVLTVMSVLIVL